MIVARIADRFASPYRRGNDTVWKLRGHTNEVVLHAGRSYRVMFKNAAWMKNDGGAARSFRSLEKAMIAAIEHAGG